MNERERNSQCALRLFNADKARRFIDDSLCVSAPRCSRALQPQRGTSVTFPAASHITRTRSSRKSIVIIASFGIVLT